MLNRYFKTYSHRIAVILLPLAVSTVAFCGVAAAKEAPLITVKPEQASGAGYTEVSFFKLEGSPGQTVRGGRLAVKNPRNRQVRVTFDPVDAQTAKNLGFAYDVRGLKIHGPARWTKLAGRKMTITPKRSAAVEFSVKIPRSAKSGDYLSGIGVEALDQKSKVSPEQGVALAEKRRYAIGVFVSIPGPRRPSIKFTGAEVKRFPAGVTFLLKAHNAGNVILRKVHGSAEVLRGGKRVLSTRIPPGTFVTNTSIKYPLLAKSERPRQGTLYRVKATMRYRGGVARLNELVRFGKKEAKIQEEFLGPEEKGGIPTWVWVVIALFGLLLLGAAAYLVRRHVKRRPLGRSAGLSLLEQELSTIEEEGRPLSVVVLSIVPTKKSVRRKLLANLQAKLRPSDVLCNLSDNELLVIFPDTGKEVATGLAVDINRSLERVEELQDKVAKIGVATTEQRMDAEELVESATEQADC